MAPKPEEILELAQKIVAAKAVLSSLESRWNSYFPDQPNNSITGVKRKGGRRSQPDSITGRILGKLAEDPAKDYSREEMGHELGIDSKRAERTLLKLYSIGKVGRIGRGRYTAKQQEAA